MYESREELLAFHGPELGSNRAATRAEWEALPAAARAALLARVRAAFGASCEILPGRDGSMAIVTPRSATFGARGSQVRGWLKAAVLEAAEAALDRPGPTV